MKFLFQYLVSFALVVLMFSCNKPGIKKDMVHFDEAYVPVLYFVYKSDMDKASNSIYLLDVRWQEFNNKYQFIFKNDPDGLERLRYVSDWMNDANDAILRDDRQMALVQLDHIKYEMMEIRRSNKIEYFLDYLWDFEGALSMLSEASCEDISLVCSADELAFLINETQYLWDIVVEDESIPFSNVFNNEKLVLFEQYKEEISEHMKIVEAERYSSYKDLGTAVDNTIESFMNLLTLFGDFESVQTFYANDFQL